MIHKQQSVGLKTINLNFDKFFLLTHGRMQECEASLGFAPLHLHNVKPSGEPLPTLTRYKEHQFNTPGIIPALVVFRLMDRAESPQFLIIYWWFFSRVTSPAFAGKHSHNSNEGHSFCTAISSMQVTNAKELAQNCLLTHVGAHPFFVAHWPPRRGQEKHHIVL